MEVNYDTCDRTPRPVTVRPWNIKHMADQCKFESRTSACSVTTNRGSVVRTAKKPVAGVRRTKIVTPGTFKKNIQK